MSCSEIGSQAIRPAFSVGRSSASIMLLSRVSLRNTGFVGSYANNRSPACLSLGIVKHNMEFFDEDLVRVTDEPQYE